MGHTAPEQGRPVTRPTEEGEGGDLYLTFTMGGEMYAIGILAVKEIIKLHGVSSVPMLPEFIRGVINLRGSVVPVVDLAAFFHGKVSPAGKRSCIVMVEVRDDEEIQCVGLVVDSVSAVIEIVAGDIEPAPAFGARINTDFIHGMGKVNDRFVIVLDVERVLGGNSLGLMAQVEHLLGRDALQ